LGGGGGSEKGIALIGPHPTNLRKCLTPSMPSVQARGSYSFRKRPLRRGCCEHSFFRKPKHLISFLGIVRAASLPVSLLIPALRGLFQRKVQAGACTQMGHEITRGWATPLLDRLRNLIAVPSSAGGNSYFEAHSLFKQNRVQS